MNVTIQAVTLDNWQHAGTAAKLRIFALQTFKSAEGLIVTGAVNPATDWYREINCTVGSRTDGTGATIRTLSIPALELPSTTDSDTPDARYYALWADDTGRALQQWFGFEYFSLPPSSPTTWAAIRAFNVLPVIPPDNWQNQVIALINSALPVAATTATRGTVKISVAQADPVAVTTNDPRMSPATTLQSGLMSAGDKRIFDGYTHDQITPSTTWVITHNLGRWYPDVQILDSANSIVIGDISHQSANQLTITFSAAFAGKAFVG